MTCGDASARESMSEPVDALRNPRGGTGSRCPPHPVDQRSAARALRVNSPASTPARKASHSAAVKLRRGASGPASLESRMTIPSPGRTATSTQLPTAQNDDLRKRGGAKSGSAILPSRPLSQWSTATRRAAVPTGVEGTPTTRAGSRKRTSTGRIATRDARPRPQCRTRHSRPFPRRRQRQDPSPHLEG
jgi:hypothetical protein